MLLHSDFFPFETTNVQYSTMLSQPPDWTSLELDGELHVDPLTRMLYSTDASEFQEQPAAVAFPRSETDVRRLIAFAREQRIGLIPRAAGTSLAGQVVGAGIVVDAGRHFSRILAIDPARRRARVQPGVIRNDLNAALHPYGLFFAPETSTADRAMIGGMVGNNSCGANSIVYGSTRDHLVSARGFLGDGSEVVFEPLDEAAFHRKCEGPDTLETAIYRGVRDLLRDKANRRLIADQFPKPSVTRRNTGYALDALMDAGVFDPSSTKPFNLCRLIAGSEGTLFFGVEFELNCEPLPPPPTLLCAHFSSVADALRATVPVMSFAPSAVELIDRFILKCTASNSEHARNRFFIEGDPGALLLIELRRANTHEAERILAELANVLLANQLGYAYPILTGEDVERVWALRRAGQALMMNMPGDTKPAEVVEDTAVAVEDLSAYMAEFDALISQKHGCACVYYGHAGAGEIHARPLLNLKTEEGHRLFRAIAEDVAALVKRYRGSLSGEHGDGRLRGEFLRFMVGDACYAMMREIKTLFDPDGIFNPGRIIDAPPMDQSHRYRPHHPTPTYETFFDFSRERGVLRAAEKCNGAGVCRRTHLAGGTMCPSYMATREEKDTTRARANLMRHVLTHPPDPARPFADDSLLEVMDLCLSCKGCTSECPTNVDLAKLKAEFLQHFYDARGTPLRARMIASFAALARWGSIAPAIWNHLLEARWFRRAVGFDLHRPLPKLPGRAAAAAFRKRERHKGDAAPRCVYFFLDEFTRFQDAEPGLAAIRVLERLGYRVAIPPHAESGRAAISKGLLRRARRIAARNVALLSPLISRDAPLIGVEPSALLTFRDEYPELLRGAAQQEARALAAKVLLIDEFLARELSEGRIDASAFARANRTAHLHGHCHQKALASLAPSVRVLRELGGYTVRVIPAGCCGMAGSFGIEAEHAALSMQIGELRLLPYVRGVPDGDAIAATGISCRQQIRDGAGRAAHHPIELLDALMG